MNKSIFCVENFYIFLAVVLLLPSCMDNNVNDLKHYVENERQKPKRAIAPFPGPESYDSYIYLSTNSRDPFTFSAEDDDDQVYDCVRSTRQKEALQQFPLDSLNLVGSLEQNGVRWALITDQNKNIYRLKKGNHIGLNEGRVLEITESEVVLEERISDTAMGCIERKSTLAINI